MKMKDKVDTLIVVSNDQLLQIVPENTPLTDAFLVADDILRQGVVGISEIIIKPGLVNVDFADVRTIMGNAGTKLGRIVKKKIWRSAVFYIFILANGSKDKFETFQALHFLVSRHAIVFISYTYL